MRAYSSPGNLTLEFGLPNGSVPGSGLGVLTFTGFPSAFDYTTYMFYVRVVFRASSPDLTIRGVRVNYTVTQAD